jgi:hypothetical protein
MKILSFVLLFSFLFWNTDELLPKHTADIEIKIIDFDINSGKSKIVIDIINNTQYEFIFYGFNVTRISHQDILAYNELGYGTAGNLLVLMDKNFEQVFPLMETDHFHSYDRIPDLDSLKKEIKKASDRFKQKTLIKPHSKTNKTLEYDLKLSEFEILPAYFFLQYYVGDKINIHIDSTELRNCCSEERIMFKGWVRSDTISLAN